MLSKNFDEIPNKMYEIQNMTTLNSKLSSIMIQINDFVKKRIFTIQIHIWH